MFRCSSLLFLILASSALAMQKPFNFTIRTIGPGTDLAARQFNFTTCPPAEIIRPCKCREHHVGPYFQTLLACNATDFKGERHFEPILHRISKRLGKREKFFDWLYLSNLAAKKISRNFFAGLRFKHLVIENAPMLKSIHPSAFKLVTNLLRYLYVYNTGLEIYRWPPMKTPLNSMRNLTEVHIATQQNICPPKELIYPCECNIHQKPLLPFEIKRQILQFRCVKHKDADFNVTKVFDRLTKLVKHTNHSMWFFDEVILRSVGELSPKAFGDVDFTELYIEDSDNLKAISRDAFVENSTLQKLRISGSTFDSDRLGETFEGINRLSFLRSLYIWSSDMDFVPEYAFITPQLYLKEIVLYGNNIRAIGSYAFANLPNVEQLRIDGNNLILIDKYAFATNYSTAYPLHITLASNNLREMSFAFMSLSGAQRPLHLSFAEIGGCFWDIQYLDENIFAPFLDKSANRLYLEPECQLKCDDCRMKWLTEIPKHAQKRITLLPDSSYRSNGSIITGYVPCRGGSNLFDIFEFFDWENCN